MDTIRNSMRKLLANIIESTACLDDRFVIFDNDIA